MDAGLEINQAEGFGRGVDRLIEPARLEINSSQLGMDQRIFRVGLERLLQQGFGRLEVAELRQRAGHTQAQAGVQHVGFGQYLEIATCFCGSVLEDSLAGEEPFHQERTSLGQLPPLALFKLGALVLVGGRRRFLALFPGFPLFEARQLGFCLDLVEFDSPPQLLDSGAPPRHLAKGTEAIQQQQAEAMLSGPSHPQLLGQGCRLAAAIPVPIGPREVVFEFTHTFVDVFLDVRPRWRHIPQVHQLFEGLGRSHRIQLRRRRMGSGVSRHAVPALDRFDSGRLLERRQQNLSIHVPGRRKTEQREEGRANVEQAGAVNRFTRSQRRAFHAQNAEMTMLDRRARRFGRHISGPQMIGVETMVAHQDHRGVLIGEP